MFGFFEKIAKGQLSANYRVQCVDGRTANFINELKSVDRFVLEISLLECQGRLTLASQIEIRQSYYFPNISNLRANLTCVTITRT